MKTSTAKARARKPAAKSTPSKAQELWTAVDRYLVTTLVGEDSALTQAVIDSTRAGLPPIQVAPNQGKLLQLLARIQGASRILEIGTLGGYSTIWLARALPSGGRLISLELESRHAEVAQANLTRAKVAHLTEIRVGRAVDSLADMVAQGEEHFDLVFIDADKPSNPAYFSYALKLTLPGSIIIVDNTVRGGLVAQAGGTDRNVRGVRRLNELIRREKRVSATCVQTVGSKGHDGLTLIRVNDSSP